MLFNILPENGCGIHEQPWHEITTCCAWQREAQRRNCLQNSFQKALNSDPVGNVPLNRPYS
jgi:hypothetical protein